ncbi:equilibrative nucleoside transporter 2-like [Polyodon spathula]|uniref:equilibrative nucleoside transporter 2-like n=1 Tax=Polyodon spathula TaxID=7913 RepID=UPI001B7DEDF3|nr:equilibrative nucleoside transporter 2-like [Polyodon spathula]XP_041099222.1 equilibrative nucleoside transporter 2-like [Polyodon spathula]XP_041099224.1 equilibrative nucleoside transporter 2-like [Polyodon spathula]
MVRPDRVEDRCCLVAIIFFILGLGTLLPWNFFMTASLYFNDRLKGEESRNDSVPSNGTAVTRTEYYFNNWMTLLSQLPLLLFTFLNSFLYQLISERLRIAGSLLFILFFFILTAVLVKIPMEPGIFFSVTMATIWFINSFVAVLQGSLFGLVGLLPQKYSTLFMSGQGLAGTFAALAMLLALSSGTDSKTAALGYFITPCVGTLVSVACYLLLPQLEFAQFYLNKSNQKKNYELENNDTLLNKESADLQEDKKQNSHSIGNGQALLSLEPAEDRKSSLWHVLKQIRVMAFCITFVFTVTLSVFPAVTVDVKTVYTGAWERYFTPVCCFLAFNVMDWAGRTVTTFVRWPRKESPLFPVLVCCRVVFVPLLMLCNVQERSYLPVLFSHDMLFTFLMLLFSLSSGYCVCLSMTYAPQLVKPQDAETAGALMTFFLALGLSLGAALSFPLRLLV